MMATSKYSITPVKDVADVNKKEAIKLDKKGGTIRGSVRAFTFLDADTKMWVSYSPALEVSGYGEKKEDAKQMLRDSIDNFFQHLLTIPEAQASQELQALGWKRSMFFKKEFSAAHVNEHGVLQGMNIEAGTLERSALATAA